MEAKRQKEAKGHLLPFLLTPPRRTRLGSLCCFMHWTDLISSLVIPHQWPQTFLLGISIPTFVSELLFILRSKQSVQEDGLDYRL